MNIEHGFPLERDDYAELPAEAGAAARRRRWLIIALGIAGLLVLIGLLAHGGDEAPAADAALPRVTVISPGRQPVVSRISATGAIAARRDMPVGVVGEGGMVTRVLVEPGNWVGAGQLLAVIERSVQTQEVRSLAASVNVARADAALAQSELDRARALVSRGFISKADVDRRTATRDAASARVAVAQAQLAEARARVGRLDIRSPDRGLVLTRAVEPGQIVGAGQTALFRIAQRGEMEFRAELPEQDLARLQVGMPAQVTPVGGSRAFSGTIWQVAPVIDPQSRQGIARVLLAYNPALRPGGFASARIEVGNHVAPVLPESAVLSDEEGNYVLIVDRENKVARRDVRIGDVTRGGIAILSGLSGQEAVVLSAGAFLNPGDPVVPERRGPRS